MAIVVAYLVSALLTAGLLWAVTRIRSTGTPIVDLLIIAGLCAGLALLPGWGWLLAAIFMWLLVLRTTEADMWPDAAVMTLGSLVIWHVVYTVLPPFGS